MFMTPLFCEVFVKYQQDCSRLLFLAIRFAEAFSEHVILTSWDTFAEAFSGHVILTSWDTFCRSV